MKILIDTHCWLWLCASPERFSDGTLARLADRRTDRFLSSASVWEMVIKYQLGRLPLPLRPTRGIRRMSDFGGYVPGAPKRRTGDQKGR